MGLSIIKSLFIWITKTFNEGESKLSESNNESIVASPTEYCLSWQSKSN